MEREVITVRMPKLTYDMLKVAAEGNEMSMNQYCIRAIRAQFAAEPRKTEYLNTLDQRKKQTPEPS